ncbi:TBC1 domain family member 31 isoform X2 [Rhinatrema bivittatum]|uniref:TBC1 domain family member 31 isoform X2 n=1 Tax=Rhinatrema bivittatum TaxID=194408 RepID=UPI00112A29CC|nr:TBC1 domain family member 31 isoform X2 [Rhinatrema bivittatum]
MQACTALAFNLRRKTEYLVALADHSIKCFDTDSRELVSWMRGHESVVSSISVHGSGRYALTTSSDTSQLWDLDTFQRKRKLNVRQSVGIQKVFFLPLSNTILTCFKDDSIFAWESDTLNCKYQLPTPDEGSKLHYKSFDVSRDGRILVAGGKSSRLHVWCLDTRKLLRIIQMPSKVRTVRQLEFLPDSFDGGSNQVLGVLSQDGILRFINIQTCKLIFDVGSHDEGITTSLVSPNGRYIVSVMDNGSLNIYSVQALTQEVNKPPLPLVKMVNGFSKGKHSIDQSGVTKLKVSEASGRAQRTWKSRGASIQSRVLKPDMDAALEDKENELPDGLSKSRLLALLLGFGEYPAKYRMFIWRSLLQLPENHVALSSLIDKGTHGAFVHLHKEYPIKSMKLLRILQRTLSALAHWSAIFSETPYLPLLAFPFVKLFQNNQLICFEVVATLIVNWCQHWFEYFPNPPINILGMVENVVAHHDKELLQHFVNHGITSQYFFHHRNTLDINAIIKEAYHLMEVTPADIHPKHLLEDFVPLTKGQYPIFNKYPKFIVDFQNQERERIRQEELEYLRERQLAHEIEAETQKRKAEDEAWYQEQNLLQEAEKQRRKILLEEEHKLVEQRQRLMSVKRELRVKELELLERARRRFLKHQHSQRKMELRRLDDEIERKIYMRNQETTAITQDIEVRQMELDAQRMFLEQHLTKDQEIATQELKAELDASRRKADLEDQMFQNLIGRQIDEDLQAQKLIEKNLVKAEQMYSDTDLKVQALNKQRHDDLNRGEHYQDLAHLTSHCRAREKELLHVIKELEAEKWTDVAEKRAELETEKLRASASDAYRKKILEHEMTDVQELENLKQSVLCNFSAGSSPKAVECQQQSRSELQQQTGNICLNDVSSTISSSHFSLDRGRGDLDCRERELMAEVRDLRQKLASQSLNRRRAASSNTTCTT